MKGAVSTRKGLVAMSPLIVFLLLYLLLSIAANDFYAVPLTVAFLAASLYSLLIMRGLTISQRFQRLAEGASAPGVMQMLWIFILAGAFAATAKQMGAIDATIQLALSAVPPGFVLSSLFLASCFISLATGTSVGTIAALAPIAGNMASQTGANTAMMVAIVVGGAYFGDNLSFISDTTIVATQTQGCEMKDKFRANIRIALPAALICLALYSCLPSVSIEPKHLGEVSYPAIIPYIYIIVTALCGMNVMLVLASATVLAGGIGMALGTLPPLDWLKAMNDGIMGMSELIIVTLLAAGLMQVIREAGGIDWLMQLFSRRKGGRRSAELSMAALVVLTDFCTANNTIAILSVGPLAKQLAKRYGIKPKRAASILDTFSCMAQGIIPYGAQMLITSGLAAVSPLDIIPYLYYPYILGAVALMYITVHSSKSIVHSSGYAQENQAKTTMGHEL
ncbi:MAG: Na+/H+ antiporter NhaC family protein [Bacteroidaceae bacterium]|nr:Na+/H+ antiporter NhaC family protein [Bacteroidaceae bacterium]